jgi:3-dehydroquinate dehydratase
MLQLHRSEINLYHQSFFSPLASGVIVGSGVALRYRMNEDMAFDSCDPVMYT